MDSSTFVKIYSNLPINIRNEIIVIIDNEPISWNVAYREISGNTEFGKKILKKIDELKLFEWG